MQASKESNKIWAARRGQLACSEGLSVLIAAALGIQGTKAQNDVRGRGAAGSHTALGVAAGPGCVQGSLRRPLAAMNGGGAPEL